MNIEGPVAYLGAMTSDVAVRVQGLGKIYGGGLRKRGHRALEGVDLAVERGTVFGLLGPNGAGKTTMVKILLGLVAPSEGEAELLGRPAGAVDVRKRVGYLPEAHRLPGYLSGREMLRLSGAMVGRDRAWVDERMEPWLERLKMTDDADRKIREYSKGMMQRIGLVQALLHEPEVVFLDEPTDGVDPVGRRAIREVCTEAAARGTTLFINSHLLMEVEMICDRIVILKDGAVLREGTLDDLTPDEHEVALRVDRRPPAGLVDAGAVTSERETPDGGCLLRLVADDDQLNAAIDALRGAGVRIQGVHRDRKTLEEAFIEMVTEGEA